MKLTKNAAFYLEKCIWRPLVKDFILNPRAFLRHGFVKTFLSWKHDVIPLCEKKLFPGVLVEVGERNKNDRILWFCWDKIRCEILFKAVGDPKLYRLHKATASIFKFMQKNTSCLNFNFLLVTQVHPHYDWLGGITRSTVAFAQVPNSAFSSSRWVWTTLFLISLLRHSAAEACLHYRSSSILFSFF